MPAEKSKCALVESDTFLFPACPTHRVSISRHNRGIAVKLIYTKRRGDAPRRPSNFTKLRAEIDASTAREASGVTTLYANGKRKPYSYMADTYSRNEPPFFVMTAPSAISTHRKDKKEIMIYKEFPYAVVSGDRCLPHIIVDTLLAPDTARRLLAAQTSPLTVDLIRCIRGVRANNSCVVVVTKDRMVHQVWHYNASEGTCTARNMVVYSSVDPPDPGELSMTQNE